MSDLKLVGMSGALRAGSYNSMLVREAARIFDPAEFIFADLRFPLYDGDLEDSNGLPDAVVTLQQQLLDADAVVISTPEYNGALSGVLKNALDWISRGGKSPLKQKPLAILSAAAGRTGGVATQISLRHALQNFQPRVLQGPSVFVAGASKEFDDNGIITNARYEAALTELMGQLRDMI